MCVVLLRQFISSEPWLAWHSARPTVSMLGLRSVRPIRLSIGMNELKGRRRSMLLLWTVLKTDGVPDRCRRTSGAKGGNPRLGWLITLQIVTMWPRPIGLR